MSSFKRYVKYLINCPKLYRIYVSQFIIISKPISEITNQNRLYPTEPPPPINLIIPPPNTPTLIHPIIPRVSHRRHNNIHPPTNPPHLNLPTKNDIPPTHNPRVHHLPSPPLHIPPHQPRLHAVPPDPRKGNRVKNHGIPGIPPLIRL